MGGGQERRGGTYLVGIGLVFVRRVEEPEGRRVVRFLGRGLLHRRGRRRRLTEGGGRRSGEATGVAMGTAGEECTAGEREDVIC
jgi:hypothetical protein